MSKPATPGWPDAGAFPFLAPFPLPGMAASSTPKQGLSGGIDLIRDFWSRLPGSAAMPGFLLPTIDVDELDKRIGDLKAAERWVEINLHMLRATIQGLEVQRHTIAAIQSLTTPIDTTTRSAKIDEPAPASDLPPGWPQPPGSGRASPTPAPSQDAAASPSPAAPGANDWLAYMQAQFTKVAQAAMSSSATEPAPPTRRVTPRRQVAKKVSARTRKTTDPR